MLSERKLKKWRRDALKGAAELDPGSNRDVIEQLWLALTINRKRILSMTQELLDQKLIKQAKKEKE